MRKILLASMLLVFILLAVQFVRCAEIDMTSYVSSVHDGDTFTLTTGEKIRLADLNAPELGQPGSYEARDYLDSLVYHQTVYMDVDDLYRTDSFGRLVCVVYVDYNSTHYLNVNKALIDGGYAEARNYDNEFNFNSFVLYLPQAQPDQPIVDGFPFGLTGAVIVFGIIALLVFLMALKKR
jgi:micrococcal nuclease